MISNSLPGVYHQRPPGFKEKRKLNVVYWPLFPARIQAVKHPRKSVNSLNEFELFDTNEYETKSQ